MDVGWPNITAMGSCSKTDGQNVIDVADEHDSRNTDLDCVVQDMNLNCSEGDGLNVVVVDADNYEQDILQTGFESDV